MRVPEDGCERHPTWLDVHGRQALAWWHVPRDARVRGTVVLLPALGSEQIATHRAVRLLADALPAVGVAALRLDLPGTGDAAGTLEDPGAVAAWPAAVAEAVGWARGTGSPAVAVAGLRLGATLAASAAAGLDLAGLALWDPCRDGASFLRREEMVRRLATSGDPADGGPPLPAGTVVGNGVTYAPEAAADLRALRLDDPSSWPATLVLLRPDDLAAGWGRELARTPAVAVEPVDGQAELLERDTNTAAVPAATLARLVAWADTVMPHARSAVAADLVAGAVVAAGPAGRVRERVVVLDDGAVAVVDEPEHPRGVGVAFLHAASVHHVGPARHWVTLARSWAAQGYRCVRVDDPDLGDGAAVGATPPSWYTPARLDGVRRAARLAREGTAGLALVGLCAGAWGVVRTHDEVRPDVALLINPLTWDPDQPPQDGPGLLLPPAPPPWVERHRLVWGAGRAVRTALGRIGAVPGPNEQVAAMARAGTAVTVVLGPEEGRLYHRFGRRGTRRELAADPRVREIDLPFDDHTLQGRAAGARLAEVLTDTLLAELPGLPPPPP